MPHSMFAADVNNNHFLRLLEERSTPLPNFYSNCIIFADPRLIV